MGYTIRIGNAVVESHWPDGKSEYQDDPYVHWYVHCHHEDSAPHFEDSGQGNDRSPSYTAWADFADSVGLREFFFNKESGKMREHPGCQKLTQEDAAMLTKSWPSTGKPIPSQWLITATVLPVTRGRSPKTPTTRRLTLCWSG